MAFPTALSTEAAHTGRVIGDLHGGRPTRSTNAVSWGAVAAGAAAAAALSLILLFLGVGLGLSSLATAALLTSVIGSIVGGGVQAGASVASGATVVDTALTNLNNDRELAEIGRILMFHNLSEPLPEDDVRHMGQLVAQRTGLSQKDAQKRVTDTYARAQSQLREADTYARAAADAARKASSSAALWLFLGIPIPIIILIALFT